MQQPVKERIAKLREEISANSGRKPLVCARWQQELRCGSGARASAAKIAGNYQRIEIADRVEKTLNTSLCGNKDDWR
jgi:hypothetical protein